MSALSVDNRSLLLSPSASVHRSKSDGKTRIQAGLSKFAGTLKRSLSTEVLPHARPSDDSTRTIKDFPTVSDGISGYVDLLTSQLNAKKKESSELQAKAEEKARAIEKLRQQVEAAREEAGKSERALGAVEQENKMLREELERHRRELAEAKAESALLKRIVSEPMEGV
eukprot:comp7931_c0_seq1/m.3483 comp7931_c0_seq1/g.3483  ORF comp7931_c0_seq1/g.3483 comp7931_c0_seq1/m.3483 type:complete len:169 (-) comp7931_c0_seq1:67-573(-)